jgi:HEAT repeat protein
MDEAVGELIASLAEADDDDRATAVSGLVALGPRAPEAIAKGLENPDEDVRTGVIEAVSQMPPATAVPLLLSALDDESWDVRLKTVEALGTFRDRRAVEPLMIRFEIDDDDQVRYECLTSLGLIGDPASVDLLSTATSDSDPYVRMWAIDALCQMSAPPAEPTAIRLLADPNRYVAEQTLRSCGGLLRGDTGTAALIEAAIRTEQFQTTVWARRYLREHTLRGATGSKVREQIRQAALAALDGPNVTHAAMLLADIGDPASQPFLIEALRDPNPYVRHHAAYLLGNSGDSAVVPALILTLQDNQQFVAATAFDSLQRFAQRGDLRAQEATAGFTGKTFDQSLPR